MNRKPTRRHFPWTAAVIGFLSLIGVGLALAGALDWPLSRSLGLSTGSAAPDFLQAARQVIFNLWFVAVFVTAFALTQQRLKRRAARLAHTPSPSQVTARGQTAAEGGMSRREFLIAGAARSRRPWPWPGRAACCSPRRKPPTRPKQPPARPRALRVRQHALRRGQLPPPRTIVPAATAVPTAQTVVTTGRRLCDRGAANPATVAATATPTATAPATTRKRSGSPPHEHPILEGGAIPRPFAVCHR